MTAVGAGGDRVFALAELSARLARCPDLDTLVGCALAGLAELFGYEHSLLLLLDEDGRRLYTIASHGYPTQGVGSEVGLGEGIVGMAGARAETMRVGNLGGMLAYARTVRRGFADSEGGAGERDIPLPGLPDAESQVAAPALVLGQLVGVVAIESARRLAFGPVDEALLSVVASMIASAIEIDWATERAEAERAASGSGSAPSRRGQPVGVAPVTRVRYFAQDGSTFIDGDYLIKGVAGRILWALLREHERSARIDFTNKEVRLNPALELPEFRDNLESRLILLKRRLDERDAPVRIEKTGRGRFRLLVDTRLVLESPEPEGAGAA